MSALEGREYLCDCSGVGLGKTKVLTDGEVIVWRKRMSFNELMCQFALCVHPLIHPKASNLLCR
jgi:hypothetical protein